MPNTLTVSEVTQHIQSLFQRDEALQDVWITGEVSNMRPASSGHWYFTVKDAGSQLRCVMFKSDASRQPKTPKDGEQISIHGSVGIYEARGEYQLYADEIQWEGMGNLYQKFEALKAKLLAEGLFDVEHKKPIPTFPSKIGVVTSPTAAAFQDIQNILRRRFPLVELILSPTLVQGDEAPPQIIRAIRRLNQQTDVEVILLIRGGGSIEDLWCFNDERVARAVYDSAIPIVTGVGHEIDFTIVDFVADLRAPTPSAAAELVTPDVADIRYELEQADAELTNIMLDSLHGFQMDVERLDRSLNYTSPEKTVRNFQQRIDELSQRLLAGQKRHVARLTERLKSRALALELANPQSILERGYALVTRSEDNAPVTHEKDAPIGTGITIQLYQGELKARVEDKKSHGNYTRTLF